MTLGEGIHPGWHGAPEHPGERPRGIVDQMPVADRVRRPFERETERPLFVRAFDQRKGLVQRVAEARVHIPDAFGVHDVRQAVHGEDEMIRHDVLGRAVRSVHTTDVEHDVVVERAQQFAQRTVQVEAVPAAPAHRDPRRRFIDVDAPGLAEVYPERLPGDALDVRAMDPEERVDRRRLAIEAEPGQIVGEHGGGGRGHVETIGTEPDPRPPPGHVRCRNGQKEETWRCEHAGGKS